MVDSETIVAVGKNKKNKRMVFMFSRPKEYWVTSTGEKISVDKLETRHIHNIIRLFKRNRINRNYLGGKDKWMKILTKELERREGK